MFYKRIQAITVEKGVQEAVDWFNDHGFKTEWSGEYSTQYVQFRTSPKNNSFIAFHSPLPTWVRRASEKVDEVKTNEKKIWFDYPGVYQTLLVKAKWAAIIKAIEDMQTSIK